MGQEVQELPLLNLSLQVTKGDILNLNNSDLIACAVISENDVVNEHFTLLHDVTADIYIYMYQ